MKQLQLLALNSDDEETYVNSAFDFSDIGGWYLCPDDDLVINIIIYGNPYLVVRSTELMQYLDSQLEK